MTSTRQAGLTLLEVLAAFMIFSLVFTVLVGSSQSAVQNQGSAMRRLAANEVADGVLADLEIPMAQHELPVVEASEYVLEEFSVRITEQGFLPGGGGPPAAAANPAQLMAGGLDLASLLATQLPDVGKYLKRYDVEVAWVEGATERSVQRTTFGFDWTAARADATGIFGAAAAANARDAASSTGDTDPQSDEGANEGEGARDRSRTSGATPTEAQEILDIMREQGVELP